MKTEKKPYEPPTMKVEELKRQNLLCSSDGYNCYDDDFGSLPVYIDKG